MRVWIGTSLVVVMLAALGCNFEKSKTEGAAKNQPTSGASAANSRVSVIVDEKGYTPSSIQAKAGEKITLVFKRADEKNCGGEVVFPDHNIKRKLPVNEEVAVELTPKENEEIKFTCGMGMYRGSIVASR